MKILVTGGAGFIGSHIVDDLVENGHNVTIMDNLEEQVHFGKKPNYLNKDAFFLRGDVRKKSDWLKALKGNEVIIHLAAAVGISQSMYKPTYYLNTNSIGTSNLYEILLENEEIRKGIQKIIIPSSKTIYGEGTYKCDKCGIIFPDVREKKQLEKAEWKIKCPHCSNNTKSIGTRENKSINALSIYALSKYNTENIALNYGSALKIPTFVFRGFSIYGPRQSLSNPYSGVCSIFLNRLKCGKQPLIFEDGKQLRDYVFIEDVKNFISKITDSDTTGVYNLGSGNPVSVLEIAKTLKEITDSDIEPKVTGEYRVGDNRHDFADMTKAQKDLNFRAKWDIKKGLEKLSEWGDTQKTKESFDKSEKIRKKYFGVKR
ncbi:MAG: SDR family NAD(P)-dependent oxidoreductase [Candidatus Aenigmarchaeota archaeon]|nr:SDR family NAD(P)-dependent oxidoreductase [Candidatus Aenigmarchaeota archaeon]